jgi:hypothetical protein
MKPRIRHIKNLWFRWGQRLNLEPEACAESLSQAGLIALTLDGTHYVETEKARSIPKNKFDQTILNTLKGAL